MEKNSLNNYESAETKSIHIFAYPFLHKKKIRGLGSCLKSKGWKLKNMNYCESNSDSDVKTTFMLKKYLSVNAEAIFMRKKNSLCKIFCYPIEKEKGITYYIKSQGKEYNLPIEEIEMHVYGDEIGILFIKVLNREHDTIEDIKVINNIGRNIMLPFIPIHAHGLILCAEELGIKYGEREYITCFREKVKKYYLNKSPEDAMIIKLQDELNKYFSNMNEEEKEFLVLGKIIADYHIKMEEKKSVEDSSKLLYDLILSFVKQSETYSNKTVNVFNEVCDYFESCVSGEEKNALDIIGIFEKELENCIPERAVCRAMVRLDNYSAESDSPQELINNIKNDFEETNIDNASEIFVVLKRILNDSKVDDNFKKEKYKENLDAPAEFLSALINGSLGTGIMCEIRKLLSIKIKPTTDDRMNVMSLIRDDILSKQIENNTLSDDLLYSIIFVDDGAASCQHEEMRRQQLQDSTYVRWNGWGTLYGMTEYAFHCITSKYEGINASVIRSMYAEYFYMFSLVIAQRLMLTKFSEKAGRLAEKMLSICREKRRSAEKNLIILQEKYVVFLNRMFISDFSCQQQGIEMYNMMRKRMFVEKEKELFDAQLQGLYESVNTSNGEKSNFWSQIWAVIAIIVSVIALLFEQDKIAGFFTENIPVVRDIIFSYPGVVLICLAVIILVDVIIQWFIRKL